MDLNISPNFTIEDIHKIREYNYEMTKNMTLDERNQYIAKGAKRALDRLAELRRESEQNYNT